MAQGLRVLPREVGRLSVLGRILRDILKPTARDAPAPKASRRVLNVGGANKDTPIPPHYDGWEHLLLDIDPRGKPDIVCDARELQSLEGGQFDAIYCSHNSFAQYDRLDVTKVGGDAPRTEAGRFR